MGRCVMMTFALLVALPAFAQDAPEVDMTDPASVAQAYMTACGEGDVATMLSLLDPKDAALPMLKDMANSLGRRPDGMRNFVTMMRDYMLLPMGMDLEVEIGERTGEDDEARLGFSSMAPLTGTVVLARQEDGTWRVKLIDSLTASAGEGTSMLAEQLASMGGNQSGPDRSGNQSQRNMTALAQALVKYASQNNGLLPPAETWMDELEDLLLDHSVFECPSEEDKPFGYAMNEALSGAKLPNDYEERRGVLLLAEWPGAERNARVPLPPETELAGPREDGATVIATADGQVMLLQAGRTLASIRSAELDANACRDHLNRLVQAARNYALDHDGVLPASETWEDDLAPYIDPMRASRSGRQTDSQSRANLQALYKALDEYANDHDRTWPDATRWVDEITPYLIDTDILKCPALPDVEFGYAMNEEISRLRVPQDYRQRQRTLLLFEWGAGEKNASATPAQLAEAERPQESGVLVAMTEAGRATIIPAGMSFDDFLVAGDARTACRQHLQELVKAARKYARENDGVLPAAESWQDDLAPYLLETADLWDLFTCPSAPELEFAYAYNEEVAGKTLADLPERGRAMVFYEDDIDTANAHGVPPTGGSVVPRHVREGGSQFGNVAYLDGSVEYGRPVAAVGAGAGPIGPLLACPAAEGVEHAYAINREVAGKKASDLAGHDRLVLFFESGLNVPNAAGDPVADAAPARHEQFRYEGQPPFHQVGNLGGSTGHVSVSRAAGPEPPDQVTVRLLEVI
ncbi:MAG TPA: hypothetical protein QGH10_18855, partial [Armatimonadota bacterium]|nr:hypothetical protein [Armatimonadota bacterium]